ncbi:hypothetical protein [uncultured Polaribacter sp.]|uniref:hypothetical protein n=1 Tax=uncultured Polaribacter sp. TaxID=174711 RepID=UPI003703C1D1
MATSLSYTDVDLDTSLSTGDTADTALNGAFNDGEYYINDGIDVFKVTLTTNGTGTNFDITRGDYYARYLSMRCGCDTALDFISRSACDASIL